MLVFAAKATSPRHSVAGSGCLPDIGKPDLDPADRDKPGELESSRVRDRLVLYPVRLRGAPAEKRPGCETQIPVRSRPSAYQTRQEV